MPVYGSGSASGPKKKKKAKKPSYSTPTAILGSKGQRRTTRAAASARRTSIDRTAKQQARRYKQIEVAKVLDEYVEKDDKGNPVFEKREVPALKTSEERVSKDIKKLEAKVKEAAKTNPPPKVERLMRRGNERIRRKHFKLTKDGKIATRTIRVPKFRKRATEDQDLFGLRGATPRELRIGPTRSGKLVKRQIRDINRESKQLRKNWKPGDPKLDRPKKELAKYFTEKYAEEPSEIEKAFHNVMSNTAKTAGINVGPLVPEIRPPSEFGTGVNQLLDWMTRPGAAVQTASAKALVEAGLIKGDNARRIRKAPGPLEALRRGHTDRRVVSGGDVTEGLFGLRELGIVSDVLHDPFMYGGVGALRKGASESIQALGRLERLNKLAPVALGKAQTARLALAAESTGDYSALNRYLKSVEQDALTRRQRLGGVKRKGKKAMHDRRSVLNKELLNDIRKRIANATEIGGKKFVLPGELMAESAGQVARHGVASRSIRPGVRLRVTTPLGTEIGSIPIPVPKKLANRHVLPTGFRERRAASERIFRRDQAATEQMALIAQSRAGLKEQLKSAKTKVQKQDINAQLNQLDDLEGAVAQSAKEAADVRAPYLESPRELTERINRQRTIRESFRTSGHAARQFDQSIQPVLSRILKKVRDDKDSLAAVQLYRLSKQDTGSGTWFSRNVRKLTDDERKAVTELEKLDRQIGKHGKDLGTLDNMIEHYVTRLYHRESDPYASLDPNNLTDSFPALGRTAGSKPFSSRHRQQPEMASIANPHTMARAIERLSGGRVAGDAAREAAEQLHRLGKIRGTTERLARAVQRDGDLYFDDLTDLERQAVSWSRHMADDDVPPLFRDLDLTEGKIQLSDAAEQHYGFNVDAFAGQTAEEVRLAKLHSAQLDRAQLDEAIANTAPKSVARKQYQETRDRVDQEIESLRASERAEALSWNKVKAGRYATDDKSLAILKTKKGWALVEPKTKNQLGIHRTLADAKAAAAENVQLASPRSGDLLARGAHSTDEPIPGAPSHYGDGQDPFDYTGRLGDLRTGKTPEDSLFPVLDPRVSTFWRTRVEGVQSALRARWTGLDGTYGRSMAEARGKVYTDAKKNTGQVSQLKRLNDKSGNHIGYQHRGTGKKYKLDEIDIPENTMIPNKDGSIFWDPDSGMEYLRPQQWDETLGGFIQEVVGDDRLWPAPVLQDVKGEMMRQGETAYKQIYETGMEHMFGRTMGMIRYGVTAPFPAFHIRNMVSDALKSLQADSGVVFHPIANAKLMKEAFLRTGKSKIKVPGFPKDMTAAELLFMMDMFGVRSTQHLAEYLRIASRGKTVGKWRRRLSLGPEGRIGQSFIEIGARREDVTRFMTFMQRMRRNGGDVADAAWFMTKHHFDYADLTLFERTKMRNLFLFYTWYRKNIPLQFAEVIARPGFFSAVGNTYYALAKGETPLNVDWSQLHPMLPDMSGEVPLKGVVPDYMMNQLGALVTNWNDHTAAFAIGAPWVDMHLLTNFLTEPQDAFRQWFTLANPAFTIVTQLAFGVEPLTGRDYKKYEPTAGPVGGLLSTLGLEKRVDDQGRPVIPWALNVILRNVPIFGRGSSYFATNPSLQDTGLLGSQRKLFQFLGVNPFISPSEDRIESYWAKQISGRVGERQKLSFATSNLPDKQQDKELKQFDRETLKWARQHKIPREALEKVQASGFYKAKKEPAEIPGASFDSKGLHEKDLISPTEGIEHKGKKIPGTDFDFGGVTDYGLSKKSSLKTAAKIGRAFGGKQGEQMMVMLAKQALDQEKPKQKDKGKSSSQVKKAVKDAASLARSSGAPAGNAEKFAAWAVKYGRRENVPPSVLYAMLGIESAWGGNDNTSSAGAREAAQFIPSTRDMVLREHGVDAYGGDEKAVEAMAVHLGRDFLAEGRSLKEAIFGYNHADWYVSDVLGKAKAYTGLDEAAGKVGSVGLKKVPLKTLRKHIKFTESTSEVATEQGAPARVTLTKMSPEMQHGLVKLSKQTGITVQINEGYRTEKHAKDFPSGTGSQHHQGNAADVNNHDAYTQEDLRRAGLNNTSVPNEPWHFQPNALGSGGFAAGGSGYPGGSAGGGTYGFGGTAPGGPERPSESPEKRGIRYLRRVRAEREAAAQDSSDPSYGLDQVPAYSFDSAPAEEILEELRQTLNARLAA